MKTAQELRVGNVIQIGQHPWVILKKDFKQGGRNAAQVKLKMKHLTTKLNKEEVYRAEDRFEDVMLDKKEVTYSYFSEPQYIFMDKQYNQYEVDKDSMGDTLNYLEDNMLCEVVLYNDKPISVELPTTIVRQVTYTEPAVKGDTSGRVLKPATLATGFDIQVPLFVNIGDKIEIDTRTGEYKSRHKA